MTPDLEAIRARNEERYVCPCADCDSEVLARDDVRTLLAEVERLRNGLSRIAATVDDDCCLLAGQGYTCGHAAARALLGGEEQSRVPHGVSYATVRDAVNESGENELHIECRFENGEKSAPIVIDDGYDDLADAIAKFLSQ